MRDDDRTADQVAWLEAHQDIQAMDAKAEELKADYKQKLKLAVDLACKASECQLKLKKAEKALEEARRPVPKQFHHLSDMFDSVTAVRMTPTKAVSKLTNYVSSKDIMQKLEYDKGVRLLKQVCDSFRYYRRVFS